jgi:hypothetical protein
MGHNGILPHTIATDFLAGHLWAEKKLEKTVSDHLLSYGIYFAAAVFNSRLELGLWYHRLNHSRLHTPRMAHVLCTEPDITLHI